MFEERAPSTLQEPKVAAATQVGGTSALSGTRDEDAGDMPFLPKHEVIRRLRACCNPATLFGESDADRLARLRALEAEGIGIDEGMSLAGTYGSKNPFLEKDANIDVMQRKKGKDNSEMDADASNSKSVRSNFDETPSDERTVYRFLKTKLEEWAEELDIREEAVKGTAQGKIATKTYRQAVEHLQPLFKLLRRKTLPTNILAHILTIVSHCEAREYVKATDAYILLSIGNAAWPIGVTSVGIHERKARERINVANIAHIMNDEATRKYLTSIKRIMTFCQRTKPADPSKMVR